MKENNNIEALNKKLGLIAVPKYDKKKKIVSYMFIDPLTGKRNTTAFIKNIKDPFFFQQFFIKGHFYALLRTEKYLYSIADGKVTKKPFERIEQVEKEHGHYLPCYWYTNSKNKTVLMHYNGEEMFTLPKEYNEHAEYRVIKDIGYMDEYPIFSFYSSAISQTKNIIVDPIRKQVLPFGKNDHIIAVTDDNMLIMFNENKGTYSIKVYKHGIKKENLSAILTLDKSFIKKHNLPDMDLKHANIVYNYKGIVAVVEGKKVLLFATDPSYKNIDLLASFSNEDINIDELSFFFNAPAYNDGNIVTFVACSSEKDMDNYSIYIFKKKKNEFTLVNKIESNEHWDGKTEFMGNNNKYVFFKYKRHIIGIDKKTGKIHSFNNLEFPNIAEAYGTYDPANIKYFSPEVYYFNPEKIELHKEKIYFNEAFYMDDKLFAGILKKSQDNFTDPLTSTRPQEEVYYIRIDTKEPKIAYHTPGIGSYYTTKVKADGKEYLFSIINHNSTDKQKEDGIEIIHWVLMTPTGKLVAEQQFPVQEFIITKSQNISDPFYISGIVKGQLIALFKRMDEPELKEIKIEEKDAEEAIL